VTIENGVRKGGMGSALLEFMSDHNYSPAIKRIGIPDLFVEHGSIPELHHLCGLDCEGLAAAILSFLSI
jgi:1-deoxy-D-xylulose-5-phosphate synthase